MSDSATGQPLTAYTGLLRRRWRLIALLTAAGLLLAGAALLVAPSTYTATTAIQVHPTGIEDLTGETAGRTNGEVNLDTEAQVVSSATVTTAALRVLEQDPSAEKVRDARERVEITVPPNSSVLEISYAGSSPEAARDTSLALAQAYLTHRADWLGQRVDERITGLDEELEAKYAQLAQTDPEETGTGTGTGTDDNEESTNISTPGREEALHAEIDALHEQRSPLAAVNDALSAGEILTQATTPTAPSTPRAELWLMAGTLLGFVSGLACSFARERRHIPYQPENTDQPEHTDQHSPGARSASAPTVPDEHEPVPAELTSQR